MKKIFFIALLILIPGLSYGSVASDFIVNNQSTYAVPAGTTKLLILDLTLPNSKLTSIKISNAGTAQQFNISKLAIFEDGPSPGWDGDEVEKAKKSFSPFFDVELAGDFSKQRIFVTVDIISTTQSGTTIKPELGINSALFSNSAFNGPTDKKITGLERMILAGADMPSVPFSPLAKSGQALSTSTIRWYFIDQANNEFGFKIFDANLKEVVRKERVNLSFLDETGLSPDTEYSGRKVVAFNDRGESSFSTLSILPAVKTLAPVSVETPAAEEQKTTSTQEVMVVQETKEPSLLEIIQTKIADIQRQINELIKQLNELINQSAATILGALQGFLQAFFGK